MKSNAYSYSKLTNVTNKSSFCWPENPTFIRSDLCHCGHKSRDHTLENNLCSKQEDCNCLGFFP